MIHEPVKIAIVDDEPVNLLLVQKTLRDDAIVCVTAEDGQAGWALLQREQPDIAVLDVMMPKIDGFELCRRVKADARLFGCYVIMLTAKSQEEDVLRGFHLGADDYIAKPFSPRELRVRVEAGIRQRGIRRELLNLEKREGLQAVVSGVSHHFNNILGGIRAYLEMALLKQDPLFAASAMQTSIHNIDAATLIIRNLGYYCGRQYLMRLEQVKLRDLLNACLDLWQPRFDEQGVRLDRDIGDLPPVGMDPEMMRIAVANLLSNALQAVEKDGVVAVRLSWKDDAIHLEVEDNGCGIAAEHLPRIFDPFFSTKALRPLVRDPGQGLTGKDIPGHGLGLSVVQGIVLAHGGRVLPRSEAGIGTCMSLVFPHVK